MLETEIVRICTRTVPDQTDSLNNEASSSERPLVESQSSSTAPTSSPSTNQHEQQQPPEQHLFPTLETSLPLLDLDLSLGFNFDSKANFGETTSDGIATDSKNEADVIHVAEGTSEGARVTEEMDDDMPLGGMRKLADGEGTTGGGNESGNDGPVSDAINEVNAVERVDNAATTEKESSTLVIEEGSSIPRRPHSSKSLKRPWLSSLMRSLKRDTLKKGEGTVAGDIDNQTLTNVEAHDGKLDEITDAVVVEVSPEGEGEVQGEEAKVAKEGEPKTEVDDGALEDCKKEQQQQASTPPPPTKDEPEKTVATSPPKSKSPPPLLTPEQLKQRRLRRCLWCLGIIFAILVILIITLALLIRLALPKFISNRFATDDTILPPVVMERFDLLDIFDLTHQQPMTTNLNQRLDVNSNGGPTTQIRMRGPPAAVDDVDSYKDGHLGGLTLSLALSQDGHALPLNIPCTLNGPMTWTLSSQRGVLKTLVDSVGDIFDTVKDEEDWFPFGMLALSDSIKISDGKLKLDASTIGFREPVVPEIFGKVGGDKNGNASNIDGNKMVFHMGAAVARTMMDALLRNDRSVKKKALLKFETTVDIKFWFFTLPTVPLARVMNIYEIIPSLYSLAPATPTSSASATASGVLKNATTPTANSPPVALVSSIANGITNIATGNNNENKNYNPDADGVNLSISQLRQLSQSAETGLSALINITMHQRATTDGFPSMKLFFSNLTARLNLSDITIARAVVPSFSESMSGLPSLGFPFVVQMPIVGMLAAVTANSTNANGTAAIASAAAAALGGSGGVVGGLAGLAGLWNATGPSNSTTLGTETATKTVSTKRPTPTDDSESNDDNDVPIPSIPPLPAILPNLPLPLPAGIPTNMDIRGLISSLSLDPATKELLNKMMDLLETPVGEWMVGLDNISLRDSDGVLHQWLEDLLGQCRGRVPMKLLMTVGGSGAGGKTGGPQGGMDFQTFLATMVKYMVFGTLTF
ncbi:hypothetical protein HDU76_002143 [Blyttiomyces sp. JEL0837]|nr:hypothetical protein HDU76_002143 [Blyttiomyces sp. JEL0837]